MVSFQPHWTRRSKVIEHLQILSHDLNNILLSAKDCFDQLDFQIKLLGNSDASYTPCVGLICAPYMNSAKTCDSSIVVYWAFPPPEGSPQDWGR